MNMTNGFPERGYRENLIHGRHGLCGTPPRVPVPYGEHHNFKLALRHSKRFNQQGLHEVSVPES